MKGGDRMYTDALRQSRKQAGMTLEQVAEHLNISKMAVSNWECGKGTAPNISRLIQLADLYNTSVDKLVGRKEA